LQHLLAFLCYAIDLDIAFISELTMHEFSIFVDLDPREFLYHCCGWEHLAGNSTVDRSPHIRTLINRFDEGKQHFYI